MENLKNGTKIKIENEEVLYEFDGFNIKYEQDGMYLREYVNDKNFASSKFEILSEEDEEIDVQSIEELDDVLRMEDLECPYGRNETMMWEQAIVQQNKINELIKAVKKLDKKIKGDE